jgi:hypothetical protein
VMEDCSRLIEQLAGCYHNVPHSIKHSIAHIDTFTSLRDNRDPNYPHSNFYCSMPTKDIKRFNITLLLANHQGPYMLKYEIPPHIPKCQSRDVTTRSPLDEIPSSSTGA